MSGYTLVKTALGVVAGVAVGLAGCAVAVNLYRTSGHRKADVEQRLESNPSEEKSPEERRNRFERR